jgi:hypothetical protein
MGRASSQLLIAFTCRTDQSVNPKHTLTSFAMPLVRANHHPPLFASCRGPALPNPKSRPRLVTGRWTQQNGGRRIFRIPSQKPRRRLQGSSAPRSCAAAERGRATPPAQPHPAPPAFDTNKAAASAAVIQPASSFLKPTTPSNRGGAHHPIRPPASSLLPIPNLSPRLEYGGAGGGSVGRRGGGQASVRRIWGGRAAAVAEAAARGVRVQGEVGPRRGREGPPRVAGGVRDKPRPAHRGRGAAGVARRRRGRQGSAHLRLLVLIDYWPVQLCRAGGGLARESRLCGWNWDGDGISMLRVTVEPVGRENWLSLTVKLDSRSLSCLRRRNLEGGIVRGMSSSLHIIIYKRMKGIRLWRVFSFRHSMFHAFLRN